MAKQMIILRGIPGCGKSTWANKFKDLALVFMANPLHVEICSADDFFMVDGEYKFDPSRLPEVHGKCLEKASEAARVDVDYIVIDNTNIQVWNFQSYLELAKDFGYEVRVIRFQCDPTVSFKRNLHGVPLAGIERMNSSWEDYPGEEIL